MIILSAETTYATRLFEVKIILPLCRYISRSCPVVLVLNADDFHQLESSSLLGQFALSIHGKNSCAVRMLSSTRSCSQRVLAACGNGAFMLKRLHPAPAVGLTCAYVTEPVRLQVEQCSCKHNKQA